MLAESQTQTGLPGADPGMAWPVKRREMLEWIIDSRPWNDFPFRDDDIVINTWSKSGTTWMQQIVGQLVLGGDPDRYCEELSPWIEFRIREGEVERAAGQTHRRFLKSHLPLDALVYSPRAKYIFVARDARDAFWSWHNHLRTLRPPVLEFISNLYPDDPPFTPLDPDMRVAFHDFLDRDGFPMWSIWDHTQGWFDARHLPNLKIVHYSALKSDLPGQIAGIADFLGIPLDPDTAARVQEYCGFDHMRRVASLCAGINAVFDGGASAFFHKGTNGRWRDVLNDDDLARFDAVVAARLTPDCARWLETGELPETDQPRGSVGMGSGSGSGAESASPA